MIPAPSLVVVGSVNADMIMKVPRLPARGETVTDGTFLRTFGGKGANQAVAAARAGAAVSLVGAVGADADGAAFLHAAGEDGIDTGAVRRVRGVATGAALVMTDAQGMNYLTVAPGANYALTEEDVRRERTRLLEARGILLQMEVPLAVNRAVLAVAAEAGVPVLLNYAPARLIERELLRDLDTLIVNEGEAAALLGVPHLPSGQEEAAAQRLQAQGPRRVVLTLGEAGAVLAEAGRVVAIPAFPVDVVDTTAAGDTFCGAFAVACAEGADAVAAARFASAAAALTVTGLGAQCSIPRRAAIEQLARR